MLLFEEVVRRMAPNCPATRMLRMSLRSFRGGDLIAATLQSGTDEGESKSGPAEEFWQVFDSAEVEDQLAIAQNLLQGSEEMPDEFLIELVARLVGPLRLHGLGESLDLLLDSLEQNQPDFYQKERWWCVLWRAENSLHGDRQKLTAYFDELIMMAHEHLASWVLFLDRCRYHEEIEDAVLSAVEFYREHREAPGMSVALHTRFAETTLQLMMADYRGSSPAEEDLLDELEVFDIPPEQRATDILDRLATWSKEKWEVEAFSPQETSVEDIEKNLFLLTVDFSGWLVSRPGWGLHRAELARGELETYLLTPGDEEERDLVAEEILLPSVEFAMEQIQSGVNPINPDPHRTAALFLSLQEWPSFLVEQGLLEKNSAESFLKEYCQILAAVPEKLLELAEDPQLFGEGHRFSTL
jgi:hypothetical protein